ncbi:GDP-mannose 4,6-dehydratase, partial [Opitutales bacterium]|nr:GDP-mannose 4,6-dehydratase [Opitutales bacterium]
KKLLSIISDYEPEYIVNFAAQGMVAQSWQRPEHWYQTNVLAQVKLHNELRLLSFLKKYVHVSTPESYGSTDGWVSENFNFAPSTPYAVSRAACDLHLKSFYKAYDFPVVITRASNVYGPGQQLYRIIPRTFLCCLTSRKLELHGGGESIRSFIAIEDVVRATRELALEGSVGESYHLSTRESISIINLVKFICKITGTKFSDLVEKCDDRLGKDHSYLLDTKKIRTELNWSDKISLEEGLRSTFDWTKKNIEILKSAPDRYVHKQ